MADLLAKANGNKAGQNESKVTCDKAYAYLKVLVDEIREAGKYVFRKDKNRLKGYASQYRRSRRKTDPDQVSE